MHFSKLNTPCDNCPFRSDKPFDLSDWKRQEIVYNLRHDTAFPCHKTVDYKQWEDDGNYTPTDDEHQCAGALIAMRKTGELFNNLSMRLAVMIFNFKPDKLDMDAPVMTLDEFLAVEDL